VLSAQQQEQTRYPDRSEQRIHHQDLLFESHRISRRPID
jgi:hypothetical protein